MGGPELLRPGVRAVPGLTYGSFAPAFREHFFESEEDGDESADQGPAGGRGWDGRVDRLRDQAAIPLLDQNEMAMAGAAAVAAAAGQGAYAADIRALYGQDVFSRPQAAFAAVTEALEYFQQTSAVFSPFSSKYDAVLRGQVRLSEPEASGLAAFNDPARGNARRATKAQ